MEGCNLTTEYDVLDNLRKLIGNEFDSDDIIVAFGDYSHGGVTEVIVTKSQESDFTYGAYINVYDSIEFDIFLNEDYTIKEVEMYTF